MVSQLLIHASIVGQEPEPKPSVSHGRLASKKSDDLRLEEFAHLEALTEFSSRPRVTVRPGVAAADETISSPITTVIIAIDRFFMFTSPLCPREIKNTPITSQLKNRPDKLYP